METIKTAIIFPAFVNEYTGNELQAIGSSEKKFRNNLAIASDVVNTDLSTFTFGGNNFLEDELKSQYISYIYSCTLIDIILGHGILPSFVTGYSMGIYAAMYSCGAISFEDGLRMIGNAWDAIAATSRDNQYSMGMIVGLDEAEIRSWCDEHKDTWICNRNNPHTFIISGNARSIRRILELAREEGALKTNLLTVSKPYHTPLLEEAGRQFGKFLVNVPVKPTFRPCLSCIDQKIIRTPGEIRSELMRNIYSRMNWYESMKFLITNGTGIFFECGAGDGLTRNFRFIEGKYRAYSIYDMALFIEQAAESGKRSDDIPAQLDLP